MSDIGKPTKIVTVTVDCKKCKGSGRAAGKTQPACAKCKGRGKVQIEREVAA